MLRRILIPLLLVGPLCLALPAGAQGAQPRNEVLCE